MSRPKSFHDLPPIAREEIAEEVRSYVDSRPPPSQLATVARRLTQRVRDSSSGPFDVEELQRLVQAKIEQDMVDKISEERDRRKEVQLELARLRDRIEEEEHERRRSIAAEKVSLKSLRVAEKKLENTRWREKWRLFATIVLLIVTALVTRFISTTPSSSTETKTTPEK